MDSRATSTLGIAGFLFTTMYTAFHIRAHRFRAGTTLRRRCYARLLCFSLSHGPLLTLSVNFSSTVYVDNGQVPRLGCNSYSLEITTTNRMRFKLWVVVGSAQIGRKSVGASVCSYMECSIECIVTRVDVRYRVKRLQVGVTIIDREHTAPTR